MRIIWIVACFLSLQLQAQEFVAPTQAIYRAQKNYIETKVPAKYQANYLSLIHGERVIQPRITGIIQQMDSNYFKGSDSLYVLEFFSGAPAAFEGWIWKEHQTNYYHYTSSPADQLRVAVVNNLTVSNTARNYIEQIANWEHAVFSVSGSQLSSPITQPFYMASKLKLSSDSVQAMAFQVR